MLRGPGEEPSFMPAVFEMLFLPSSGRGLHADHHITTGHVTQRSFLPEAVLFTGDLAPWGMTWVGGWVGACGCERERAHKHIPLGHGPDPCEQRGRSVHLSGRPLSRLLPGLRAPLRQASGLQGPWELGAGGFLGLRPVRS